MLFFDLLLFQWSDAVKGPSPVKESSRTLEQAFGLYEATFCATAQLLPEVDSVRAMLPPSESSVTQFEKQDSATHMESAASTPPLKRYRRALPTTPELRGPFCHICQAYNKRFPQETHVQSESNHQTCIQKGERSSSGEHSVLSQHHNSALCVR